MSELIDLTMPLSTGMNTHPMQEPPEPFFWKSSRHGLTYQAFEGFEDPVLNPEGKPFSIENESLVLSAHTGTHMDSPVHVDPESDVGIDAVDLDRLHSDCLLLDVSDRVGEGTRIEREDLEAAADEAGVAPDEIATGDSLFVRTGWSENHLGSDTYHRHPGLTDSSAKWCIEREVGLVGIDCPNIDVSSSARQPAHVGFLRRGWPDSILVIENLANLSAVPDPWFEVWTVPLPFVGGSGSPCRVIAVVD